MSHLKFWTLINAMGSLVAPVYTGNFRGPCLDYSAMGD